MARLTLGQKAERVLGLLLGLRNQRVADALTRHGFTNRDLEEGWTLLRQVTRTHLDAPPERAPMDPDTLEALDQWENRWFAIASATLARRTREAHDWLFRNLSQTEGPSVVVSVSTFLERLAELKSKKGAGLPADAALAVKLLAERGLTDDVVNAAENMVAELRTVEIAPDLPPQPTEEELAKSEQMLWSWYLEWSQIARIAIKQRALLRLLGFLQAERGSKEADKEEQEGEEPQVTPVDGAQV
jgi:hypothetical protein